MIIIKVFTDGLYVKGHANFSKKGTDIICSAVSAVVQGYIKSFPENMIDKYIVNEKLPSIYFKSKIIISKESINIITTQLKCIYHSSENAINLEIFNDKIKKEIGND